MTEREIRDWVDGLVEHFFKMAYWEGNSEEKRAGYMNAYAELVMLRNAMDDDDTEEEHD